jgi:hypothetical protein
MDSAETLLIRRKGSKEVPGGTKFVSCNHNHVTKSVFRHILSHSDQTS